MTRSVTTRILLAAWLAAALAWADESTVRRYELPNHDTLELSMPGRLDRPFRGAPGRRDTDHRDCRGRGRAPTGLRAAGMGRPTAKDVRELPQLRDAVRDLAERIQPEAVENYLEVRHIAGTNGVGFYFTATDRNPGPDEFKFMNQGALQAGGLTLWFTILTNEGQDTVAVEALAMLQAAVHRRTGHDQL